MLRSRRGRRRYRKMSLALVVYGVRFELTAKSWNGSSERVSIGGPRSRELRGWIKLLDLLRHHDVPLIEDDAYAELHFDRHAPLATEGLDRTVLVMHLSGFSKSLAPGYRVGGVAAGRHAQKIQRLKVLATLATTIPVQIALAEFFKQGAFDAHLRRLRSVLEAREAAMASAIRRYFPSGTRVTRPRGGYFKWAELPPGRDALALHHRALAEGICIAQGPMFYHARVSQLHPPELLSCLVARARAGVGSARRDEFGVVSQTMRAL